MLVDRDYIILREVERWRGCLGRHIQILCGFSGRRSTDRRLHILIGMGYLQRQKVLYGVPSLYNLTSAGKTLLNKSAKRDNIKIETIIHDTTVLDIVCFFIKTKFFTLEQVTSEKQLHQRDGFGNRTHRPDFVYTKGKGKYFAVEIELTPKSKVRTEEIVKSNYMNYEAQVWIVPDRQQKIREMLEELKQQYDGISILSLENFRLNE